MSDNRALRWFYWMLYAIFVGGILLAVAGFNNFGIAREDGGPQGAFGAFFYIGFFAMGLGMLIDIVMMFVLDESSINDVEPQNKVLRIGGFLFCVAALVIYAILTFAYDWRGILFIVDAIKSEQNAPLVWFLFYVILCGFVGYYIFLQLIESEGDVTQFITVETVTYDFAPSEPITRVHGDPHIHKGQFVGFGLLGVLFSLLSALTPLCFPIFAFCGISILRIRNKTARIVIFAVASLLAVVGIVLPFVL